MRLRRGWCTGAHGPWPGMLVINFVSIVSVLLMGGDGGIPDHPRSPPPHPPRQPAHPIKLKRERTHNRLGAAMDIFIYESHNRHRISTIFICWQNIQFGSVCYKDYSIRLLAFGSRFYLNIAGIHIIPFCIHIYGKNYSSFVGRDLCADADERAKAKPNNGKYWCDSTIIPPYRIHRFIVVDLHWCEIDFEGTIGAAAWIKYNTGRNKHRYRTFVLIKIFTYQKKLFRTS